MSLASDCARVLAVLELGGERKPNVLAGMLRSRPRADAAIEELKRQKLVRMRQRNGGPHVVPIKKGRKP